MSDLESNHKSNDSWGFDHLLLEEESYKEEPNMNTIVSTLLEEITSLRERVSRLENKLENGQ